MQKGVPGARNNEEPNFSPPPGWKPPSVYNVRICPNCGMTIYGMPGGRDAVCHRCGFKDPCCGD